MVHHQVAVAQVIRDIRVVSSSALSGSRCQTRASTETRLALTQQPADIADRENADKALDARAGLELDPRVVVELRDFIDRHLRFPGKVLDGPLVNGSHRFPWTRRSWVSSQLETASMPTPITDRVMASARFGSPRRSQMFTA